MNYLDYSATTPVDPRVLDVFTKMNLDYFGNPNSTHELGFLSKTKVQETTDSIKTILQAENYEVIYTSGATESNNLAIKGFAFSNMNRGKHIISSPYEHSSVTSCLNYLARHDFDIDILSLEESGQVNLGELEELIRPDTILVSIALINSELGIMQNLSKIKEIIRKYPHVKFHSDLTQAIGKVVVDIAGIDLVSFSGHKIYGLKGIGALLRKHDVNLFPVIHGGKSPSIFRGGTPSAPLIASLGVALELAYDQFDQKINHLRELHRYLIQELRTFDVAHINYEQSIFQIVNVSFKDIKASHMQAELSKRGIYISTQTACSSDDSFSPAVKLITGSDKLAETSVRISLSHLTTKIEIDQLIRAIGDIIHENR